MDITAKPIPEFDHLKVLKFIQVDVKTGCWMWIGQRKRSIGYGVYDIHIPLTRKKNTFKAHRLVYDLFVGITDLTFVIDHICGEKYCCNPEHLREVSRKINTTENSLSVGALNKLKTHCLRGHEFTGKDKGRRRCLVCKDLLIKAKKS